MTDRSSRASGDPREPDAARVDATPVGSNDSANAASQSPGMVHATARHRRMSDYLLGGKTHFAVDREVIDYVTATLPRGTEGARAAAAARRAFGARALRYMATEADIRQFLCVGTNMPTIATLHQAVRDVAPRSHLVYVIDDDLATPPTDLSSPSARDATAAYIRSSPGRADTILSQSVDTLDLDRPVGLILHGIVTGLPDEVARVFVRQLLDNVVPGSYLALVHWASDLYADVTAPLWERMHQMAREGKTQPIYPRSHGDVCRFFDGLEVLTPGVVPIDRWRPDPAESAPRRGTTQAAAYGGVARKRR